MIAVNVAAVIGSFNPTAVLISDIPQPFALSRGLSFEFRSS
jgi:hypothetical protein